MLGAPQSGIYVQAVSLVDEVLAQMARPPVTQEFIDKVAMGLALAVETGIDSESVSTLLWRLPSFEVLGDTNQDRYLEAFSKAIELRNLKVIDEFLNTKHEVQLSTQDIFYGLRDAQKGQDKDTIEKLGIALSTSKATLGVDSDVAHDFLVLIKDLIKEGHTDLVKVILNKHFSAISKYHQSLINFCFELHQSDLLYYFIDKDLYFKNISLSEVIRALLAWLKSAKQQSNVLPHEVILLLCIVVAHNADRIPSGQVGDLLLYLQEADCIRELRELVTKQAKSISIAQLETCLFHALERDQAQIVSMFVEHLQTNQTVWNKLPWTPSLRMFEHVISNIKLDLLERLLLSKHHQDFISVVKRALNVAASEKRLEAIACIFRKVPELTFEDKDNVVDAAPEKFQTAIRKLIEEEKAKVRSQILLDLEFQKLQEKIDTLELTSQNIEGRLHTAISALEIEKAEVVEATDLDKIVSAMDNHQLQQYKIKMSQSTLSVANDSLHQPKETKRFV